MANKTLSTVVSEYRTTQQAIVNETPTSPLLSMLNINGQLYAVKDPAVEQLATAVETRLETLESKSWTPVTKGQNDGQFATSVSQDENGAITVNYSDALTTDVKRTATAAITTTGSEQIALAGTTTEAALIELAKAIAAEQIARSNGDDTLLGTDQDASTANTIYGAKKYAQEAVANLAGTDWEANAKKVQEIIAELENADNANAWATAIDKLAGLGVKTPAVYYTQEECEEYNTANGLKDGDEGYRTTSDIKTPAVYNTVKDYVDNAIVATDVSGQIASAINSLDATVGATSVATGAHVAVQIVETDGILTGVTVTENDIASAQDLSDLEDAIDEQNEVTAGALTDLDSRITTINLNKANKAAITTGTINNWTASYVAGTETLQWSNTATSVYVPVSGETL